jgi:hypothetical protein
METTGTQNATPQADTNASATDKAPGQALTTGAPAGAAVDAKTNAIKDAAKEAIRKHKLKVDGEEIEVDEEELKRGYTHQREANKKMQEGLKAKKQAEEFVKMLKADPLKVLSHPDIGHDVRKLAEEYLAAQLEDEMLDPKEKELRTYKQKLEAYENEKRQEREAKEKEATDKLKAEYSKKYSEEFVEALKTVDLPGTKEMVGQMARYIARAASINFPMTPLEAAKLVQEDEDVRIRHRLKNATPEQMVKILDEEGLQKVRSYDTARLKDPNAGLSTPKEQSDGAPRKRDSSRRMTPSEWREFNRK